MSTGKRSQQPGPSGKRRPKSPTYVQRVTERVRESATLGRVLVTEPRSFPAALWLVVRRWIRKVWQTRGGGLYACGFVVAFFWLEITTLLGEFNSSDGVTGFLGGQLLQFLLRFTVDSLVNTVLALIWPLLLIAYSPLWGAVVLAAMYLLFPHLLKKPLERLLFDDSGTAGEVASGETDDTG